MLHIQVHVASVKLQSAIKLYIIEHKIDDIQYIGKITNSN